MDIDSKEFNLSLAYRHFAALDNAMCTTGQILDPVGSFPWLSENQAVIAAWEALVRPENLPMLEEWLSHFQGNMNPSALQVTIKAIETCRSRQATSP